LPAGTGNEVKVCVFAGKEFQAAAQLAGADVIGSDDLLKEMQDGNPISFDKIIATPD